MTYMEIRGYQRTFISTGRAKPLLTDERRWTDVDELQPGWLGIGPTAYYFGVRGPITSARVFSPELGRYEVLERGRLQVRVWGAFTEVTVLAAP